MAPGCTASDWLLSAPSLVCHERRQSSDVLRGKKNLSKNVCQEMFVLGTKYLNQDGVPRVLFDYGFCDELNLHEMDITNQLLLF